MSISVENVLKLPEMNDVSVVAGSAGLGREISSVNVMEVPDIANYLKSGVLLITTMYSIREDEEMQRRLIPLLVDKGVTALALAPLQKRGDIPGFMLRQADEAGLPLLKLPFGTSFDDIMNIIFQSIIEKRYRSGLIENILDGKLLSLPRVLAAGQSYGWNLEGMFIPVAAHGNISVALPSDVIAVDLSGNTLLLFPLSNPLDAKSRTDEIISILRAGSAVTIGIGRAIGSIIELPIGYAQAEQAINISRQAKGAQNIVCYDDLGVYRVLSSSADIIEKQLFIDEFLGAILKENDLIATLRFYFESHGNQRTAAKAMNVHHNTISYRMARIEQLTGLRLNNPDDYLCLQIALKLLDIINL
jgi:hypothetical protein